MPHFGDGAKSGTFYSKYKTTKENVDEFIKEFEEYNKKTEIFNYDELGQDSKIVYDMLIEIRGVR